MTDESKAKGGNARARALTPEKRKEIAQQAATLRWNMDKPKATHSGTLEIGNAKIPCAVLEGGTRVLSESGISESFGSRTGGAKKAKRKALDEGCAPLPIFVASERLKQFISNELEEGLKKPITYIQGSTVMKGFPAELLPKICEVWLKARDAGVLQEQQKMRALKAEILMRGLAHVGIVALVDEATGFQRDRARDALAKILEAFIAKELQPWVHTFPDDFYAQLFRIKGLHYPKDKVKRPQYFGHIINDIIYRRLAPRVLEELRRTVPRRNNGRLKHHLHRRLTPETGHPKLREHLASVTTIMKLSTSYEDFKTKLDQVHPRYGETFELPFPDEPLSGL